MEYLKFEMSIVTVVKAVPAYMKVRQGASLAIEIVLNLY